MKVELVGEIVDVSFERGISQYPTINDDFHLVTEDELNTIYDTGSGIGQVMIGRLSAAESIPVRIDLDKLVTRHSAVLGSTGSGKSTTVASLLRSIAGNGAANASYPSSRIIIIDVHGGPALKNISKIFKAAPSSDESPLFVPYWAIETGQLLSFLMGRLEDKALTAISDKIVFAKSSAASTGKFGGADVNSLTVETPLPVSSSCG
jgi:DNA helicase HerA-like ATPase